MPGRATSISKTQQSCVLERRYRAARIKNKNLAPLQRGKNLDFGKVKHIINSENKNHFI